jgi:hypothetical protein
MTRWRSRLRRFCGKLRVKIITNGGNRAERRRPRRRLLAIILFKMVFRIKFRASCL